MRRRQKNSNAGLLNRIKDRLTAKKGINNPVLRKNLNLNEHKVRPGDPDLETPNSSGRLSTYIILGLLVFFSFSLFRNITNVKMVEKRIKDKEMEVEKVRQEQAKLERELENAKSEQFMEKQLRDKLGLAKEGEMVVVLPPPEVLRKFAPHYEEEKVMLPDPNWKKWMKLFI